MLLEISNEVAWQVEIPARPSLRLVRFGLVRKLLNWRPPWLSMTPFLDARRQVFPASRAVISPQRGWMVARMPGSAESPLA